MKTTIQQIRGFTGFFALRGATVLEFGKLHGGFSLLELVVVMAIIAVLALMTIPMFYSKVPRAQVEESMALIKFAQQKVEGYYGEKKALPANNDVALLQPPDKIVGLYVSAVTVVDGAINVKFRSDANGKIAGKQITWRPVISNASPIVNWVCGYKKPPNDMQTGGVNVTDVPRDAVPVACL